GIRLWSDRVAWLGLLAGILAVATTFETVGATPIELRRPLDALELVAALGAVPSFRHRFGQQVVEPQLRARELKQREVVPGGLLETRRNGAKALQAVEEDLDAISAGVALAIQPRFVLSSWVRMDDRLDAERSKLTPNGVRVVASIGDQGFTARVFRD